jgi:hypothetical protein
MAKLNNNTRGAREPKMPLPDIPSGPRGIKWRINQGGYVIDISRERLEQLDKMCQD